MARAKDYQYERLTFEWWYDKIRTLAADKDVTKFQNLFPNNLAIASEFKVILREFVNLNTSCPNGKYEDLPKLEDIKYWRNWLKCLKMPQESEYCKTFLWFGWNGA